MATRVPPVVPGTRKELASIEASILAERGEIPLLYQVLLNSAPVAQGKAKLDSRTNSLIRKCAMVRASYAVASARPRRSGAQGAC